MMKFSISTLILLTALVAVALGWFYSAQRAAESERRLATKVGEMELLLATRNSWYGERDQAVRWAVGLEKLLGLLSDVELDSEMERLIRQAIATGQVRIADASQAIKGQQPYRGYELFWVDEHLPTARATTDVHWRVLGCWDVANRQVTDVLPLREAGFGIGSPQPTNDVLRIRIGPDRHLDVRFEQGTFYPVE